MLKMWNFTRSSSSTLFVAIPLTGVRKLRKLYDDFFSKTGLKYKVTRQPLKKLPQTIQHRLVGYTSHNEVW